MSRPIPQSEIHGKHIARILQTPWEHSEEYSYCNFYIELTDGTVVHLGDDSIALADHKGVASLQLVEVEIESDFPAMFSSHPTAGRGAVIERVLVDPYRNIYVQLSGQYFLHVDLEEGRILASLCNRDEFLYWARLHEFFDYWSGELVVFDNLRAIDIVITSDGDDLELWQSRELFLTIGRLRKDKVSDLLGVPNDRIGEAWKARFVVPELGTYRLIVQRQKRDFRVDVKIDESVMAACRLDIHIA
jgi:hypothetical protein